MGRKGVSWGVPQIITSSRGLELLVSVVLARVITAASMKYEFPIKLRVSIGSTTVTITASILNKSSEKGDPTVHAMPASPRLIEYSRSAMGRAQGGPIFLSSRLPS